METRAMPVIGNVVKFPIDRIDEHELKIRLWELTMSGERNTDTYRAIERELAERVRRF